MEFDNYFKLEFEAKNVNESFARSVAAVFCTTSLSPTLSEVNDIRTAVSEAVTNSIVHGYSNKGGKIVLEAGIVDSTVYITVTDFGSGIDDIEMALQPFYTSKASEEHSGMGFTLMDSFMNGLEVKPNKPTGLIVKMKKVIKG
ncbi:MAG: anti-sigma F factor [Clostridia bacterium]|nr:anti-sigma F factor [Clostridia bacterium]